MQIKVIGKASQREFILEAFENEKDEILLFWLRKNQIFLASSCSGQGICKKCVIQNQWTSCELTLREFQQKMPSLIIEVDYL